jgi:hypothetical protein
MILIHFICGAVRANWLLLPAVCYLGHLAAILFEIDLDIIFNIHHCEHQVVLTDCVLVLFANQTWADILKVDGFVSYIFVQVVS